MGKLTKSVITLSLSQFEHISKSLAYTLYLHRITAFILVSHNMYFYTMYCLTTKDIISIIRDNHIRQLIDPLTDQKCLRFTKSVI